MLSYFQARLSAKRKRNLSEAQRAHEQQLAEHLASDQVTRMANQQPIMRGDTMFKTPDLSHEQSSQEQALRREHVS